MPSHKGKADAIDLDMPAIAPGADLLQRVPLFKTLGWQETSDLSQITRLEKREKGDVLIAQDSLGSALFIIREGSATVRRRDPVTGEQKDLTTLNAGDLFGEMSLIDDQLASADVVAATDVELLVLPRKEFEQLMASHDKLAVKVFKCFCRSLADKLRKTNGRLAEAQAKLAKAGT